jgi:hypothetical protein
LDRLRGAVTERPWRVVCIPDAEPPESGMARQKELADDLTAKGAARTLLVWR